MLPNCHLRSGSGQGLPRFLGGCPPIGCDRTAWVVKRKPAILLRHFIIISLFFPPPFPLPRLISAVSTYVTTLSKWWTGTKLPALFSAGWRQSGAEAGPFLCTA